MAGEATDVLSSCCSLSSLRRVLATGLEKNSRTETTFLPASKASIAATTRQTRRRGAEKLFGQLLYL